MAFIRQVDEPDADGRLARIYEAARARAGSVANIIKVQSLDAEVAQASMQLYASLMKRENRLSPARRELIAAVVSNVNACYY